MTELEMIASMTAHLKRANEAMRGIVEDMRELSTLILPGAPSAEKGTDLA